MRKLINGIGTLIVGGLCFIGARSVVQDYFDSKENRTTNKIFEAVREEASQNGVASKATEEVITQVRSMVDSGDLSDIEAAYGEITGTDLQIRQQLNANPQRKEIVGRATVDTILEYIELPIQLDEITVLSDVYYEAETESVVYVNLITEDFSDMPDSFWEELREELNNFNPDAQCRTSLSLLKQGFDMTYSYMYEADREIFRIVRDYESCQALGFL